MARMMTRTAIGRRLRFVRTTRNLTQQELAARTGQGINYTLIGKIERGETMPSVSTMMKLAVALRLQVSYFFGENPADDNILGLGRNPDLGYLVRKIRGMGADEVALLCGIVRLLARHRHRRRRPAK